MFGERVRRGWRAGVAALLAALALALVWQAGVSPDVAFLWPAWQGAWIVHPYPAVKFQGSPTCPATVFALQFVPAAQPAHCRVRIAALGDFTATLNGRPLPKPQTQNWKRGTDYDLAADLRAGNVNHRVVRLVFPADEFVFLLDGRNRLNLRVDDQRFERMMTALVADAGDDAAFDAANQPRFVAEFFHGLHNLLDGRFRAANF